jgi:glucose/mannose-6-phosphate isomerase
VTEPDPGRLDDAAALRAADPSDMVRAVATSAAQVRAGRTAAAETSLAPLDPDNRPRAVVVAGMGGSGIAGEVLTAVAGAQCRVPIVVHRGYGLPGWVGAADLVIAVSCSGATQETLSSTAEAARRGARLLGVGGEGSPLARLCEQANGAFTPVVKQLSPRSSLWALAVPPLVVSARLGLLDLGHDDGDLEAAALRLESIAAACHPERETFVNPAKTLADELSGSLPMIWGAGQTAAAAATRFMCQLAENAKWPSIAGVLPEAHHNQVVAFDGPLAGGASDEDIFRDRIEEPDPLRLRLVLLRDDADDESAQRRADASASVAGRRGVAVSEVPAQGASPLERLASMVGLIDFTSVYLGLLRDIDPTPIGPIDDLKRALA